MKRQYEALIQPSLWVAFAGNFSGSRRALSSTLEWSHTWCIICGYYISITFDFHKTSLNGPKSQKMSFAHRFVQNVDYLSASGQPR